MSNPESEPHSDSLDRRQTIPGEPSAGQKSMASSGKPGTPADSGPLEDRYDLEARLGDGGMGQVWRARDRRLGRSVAIKRLKGDWARHPKAPERFLSEARAVARLNHPNIVAVYDFGCNAAGPYLVMELVEGGSLASRLRASGPMEPAEALKLIDPLCDALATAHRGGVVHRDVKPSNVLLSAAGAPKLGDFGLARLETADYARTQTGTYLGTPDFMAPEQREDPRRADARSDLWSLAATLYQMLTGQPPRVIISDRIPEPLRPVLLKALDEDPDRRYQTIGAFRAALADSQAEVDSSLAKPEPAPRSAGSHAAPSSPSEPRRRTGLGAVAVAVLVVAVLILGVWVFRASRPTDREGPGPAGEELRVAQPVDEPQPGIDPVQVQSPIDPAQSDSSFSPSQFDVRQSER